MPITDVMTSDFAYVRLEGDRRKVNERPGKPEMSRKVDIVGWADRIKQLSDLLADLFVHFGKFYSATLQPSRPLHLDFKKII